MDILKVDTTKRNPHLIPGGRRETLVNLFREMDFKVGAEIGVEQGHFTKVLAEANPQAKIYAIDAWAAYKSYRDHVSQEKLDGFYQDTLKRVEPYNVEVIRGFSMDVVKQFEDNSLDFVFIDGNHNFINVAQDIYHWHQKVRPGGIVSGHDFRRGTVHGWDCAVKDVVPAWCYSQGITPWFVVTGDKSPSWFYVKV
jgi:predicted O-methyltransferase YrrM